jgi:hypothetical protein
MNPGLLGETRDLGVGDELAEGPLDLPLLQRGGARPLPTGGWSLGLGLGRRNGRGHRHEGRVATPWRPQRVPHEGRVEGGVEA